MPLHAGEHRAVGPYRALKAHRGGPDRRRIRLYGLAGVLVCAVVLPFTVASAGGAGRGPAGVAPARTPLPPGPALAARCGPELTSPAGVEAQTCVLARGTETWARTYYRNATGGPLESVLSLMGPGGRSTLMRCAVSADDAPGTCETPPEHTRGGPAGYTAIAEFTSRAGYGPLLLHTGSDGNNGSRGDSEDSEGSGGDESSGNSRSTGNNGDFRDGENPGTSGNAGSQAGDGTAGTVETAVATHLWKR
jgi:hypothetical protein